MINKIKNWADKNADRMLVIILLLQVVVLIGCFAKNGSVIEPDSNRYIAPAKSFLESGKFLDTDDSPILFRTPGYPLFLSAIYFLKGNNDVVVFIQMIMVVLATYLIYKSADMLTDKKYLSILAAAFFALDTANYFHAVSILTDTFFSFLSIFIFYLLIIGKKKNKNGFFIAAAILMNYAMLVRPGVMYLNMIYCIILMLCAIFKKVSWRKCLIFIICFVAVYGGWSARNAYHYGRVMFTSVRSESYYLWYAEDVYRKVTGSSSEEAYAAIEKQMSEKYPNFDELDHISRIDAEEDIGKSYVNSHFSEYLLVNIEGLVKEMIAPDLSTIDSWQIADLLKLLLKCFFAGILVLSYLIYAIGFFGNIKKWNLIDYILLMTVMYMMASTAICGYCRFRLAFYPLCLVGMAISHKKMAEKGMQRNDKNCN